MVYNQGCDPDPMLFWPIPTLYIYIYIYNLLYIYIYIYDYSENNVRKNAPYEQDFLRISDIS